MAGLFAGMICLGLVVDQIGRKWASVTTAAIMFVGELLILIKVDQGRAQHYTCRHLHMFIANSVVPGSQAQTAPLKGHSEPCRQPDAIPDVLTSPSSHSHLSFRLITAAGVLLTSADGPSAHAVFAFVTAAQALFGFGCGGEFPVAAASAAERAESTEALKGLRGQTTVLVFSMQVSDLQIS